MSIIIILCLLLFQWAALYVTIFAIWFGPENIVCFLCLLHIFKSTNHGSTLNSGQTAIMFCSARFLSENGVVRL